MPARSRFSPPGPNAEIRRLCSNSDNGLYASINWDNWLVPKNSATNDINGFTLTTSWGCIVAIFGDDKLSRTNLSMRTIPVRKFCSNNSPTVRTRRFDRLSISSIVSLWSIMFVSVFNTAKKSALVNKRSSSGFLPESIFNRLFILKRPTADKS